MNSINRVSPGKVEQILPDEYKDKQINPLLMLMLLLAGNADALHRLLDSQGDEVEIYQAACNQLRTETEELQKQIAGFGEVTVDNSKEYRHLQAKMVKKQALLKMMMNTLKLNSNNGFEISLKGQESSMDLATSLMRMLLGEQADHINR